MRYLGNAEHDAVIRCQLSHSSLKIVHGESPVFVRPDRRDVLGQPAVGDRLVGAHSGPGHGLPAMIDHDATDRNAGLQSNGIDNLKLLRRALLESERRRDETGIALLRQRRSETSTARRRSPARDVAQAIPSLGVGRRLVPQLIRDAISCRRQPNEHPRDRPILSSST